MPEPDLTAELDAAEDGSVVVRPFRGLRRVQVNDSAPAGAVKEDGGP